MAPVAGTHTLGPGDGELTVRTYRDGVAAKAGHDLIIAVEQWEAAVTVAPEPAGWAIELRADPRSLRVRTGVGGVKPLTDSDRAEIRKTIDAKVLGGEPIVFRSTVVRPADGGAMEVEGELTMAGRTQPVAATLTPAGGGRIAATIPLTQSRWGIKPYRGLLGALKVRDEVEVAIGVRLPGS